MINISLKNLLICAAFVFLNATLDAQCLADRHTTNLTDGWMSCEVSPNPVNEMGNTHWIAYDLGQVYAIYDIHLWNISHPGFLKNGVKDIVMHYSTNGTDYFQLDTFSVPRGNPSGFYEGFPLTDLSGLNLRHFVITALNSHGGTCAGFAEIRMHTSDITASELTLDLSPCENAGLLRNLTGGLDFEGTYSGPGVIDHGNETFDFDPDLVGPGNTIIEYTYDDNGQSQTLSTVIQVLPCGDVRCPDCKLCDTDTSMLNSANIPTGRYHHETLTSAGQVQNPNNVIFRGREDVTLLPGFAVNTSSEFLAEIRTCEINTISNGGFEDGNQNWNFWYSADSTYATRSATMAESFEGNQSMHVEVVDGHPDRWRVQLYQGGIQVEQGKTYRVSFAAKSVDAQGFSLIIELNGSPYTTYLDRYIALKPHWQHFSFEFDVEEVVNGDVRWSAHMARNEGNYFIDQVRVSEK